MGSNQILSQLDLRINAFNQRLNVLMDFIVGKLKNFKNLTLREQIAYSAVGAGLLLVLISIILFVV